MRNLFPRTAAATAAAMVALAAAGSFGCDPYKVPRMTAPCGVLVDGSGSGANFHPAQLLTEYADDFLFKNKCRDVAFGPITGASEESTCEIPAVDIDPDDLPPGADRGAVRRGARTDAVNAARKMLACAQGKGQVKGSDVIGGVARIVRQRPEGSGTYHVLVVSDFAASDATTDLYTANLADPAVRGALVRKAAGRMQDLAGVALTTRGFGAGISAQPAKFGPFTQFWTELIRAEHGAVPRFT
ncbi:hypothetical protein GCM10029978_036870 [Actinoallomurus acanthiterrae]